MYGATGDDLSSRRANKLRMGTPVALAASACLERRVSVGRTHRPLSSVGSLFEWKDSMWAVIW